MSLFRSGKPSFRATQSLSQVIAAGAVTLQFDTVEFEEPAGLWDGVSNFTVDRPGLYLLGVQAGRLAVATSSTVIVRARIGINTRQSFQTVTSTSGIVGQTIVLTHLDAGDVFSGNVTFHPTLASATIATQTQIWAARVGPKRWT